MNDVAERYAAALLRAGGQEQALRTTAGELTQDPPLWQALTNPAVRVREKKAVLCRLDALKREPLLLHFYQILADKDRLALLPEIVGACHQLSLRARNAAEGVMRCAAEPSAEQRAALEARLCELHGRSQVTLRVERDGRLIGGFVLELEGVTYDASVRGRLSALALKLC